MTAPSAGDTGADDGTTAESWELRLYVVGRSPKCLLAIENLRRVCEQHLAGRYRIELVDLLENPRRAAEDQIVAAAHAGPQSSRSPPARSSAICPTPTGS